MHSESSSFHMAVFDALCACLNLNRNAAGAAALIQEAYAEPENAPRPPRNRNVIYWTVLQDPDADPVSTEYTAEGGIAGSHTPVICTTLKYRLIIVCYGPAAEEYALRIRSMLYLDGAGFPRRILRNAGIFPVPDPPLPLILHEEEGSLWRRRADLSVQLRVRDEQTAPPGGSVTVPPTVFLRQSV